MIGFLLGTIASAQDISNFDSLTIEQSTSFYWGKGRSTQETKAIELARAELSEKIVMFLYSTKQVQTISTETGGVVTQTDYINTYTKRFSALLLTGLETKSFSTEYGYVCWVFISKENWEKSLAGLAEKVEVLVNSAEQQAAAGNRDQAISLFYKAYLLSYTSPKELYFKGTTNSLRAHAESEVQKLINGLKLIPGKPVPDSGDEMALKLPLSVQNGEMPANNLNIWSDFEERWTDVVDGSLTITIDLPKLPNQQINFDIKPMFSGEDYLAEIDKKFPLRFKKKVEVDFSSLISIDFKGSIKNNVLSCEPVTDHINVMDVDWYFAGGKKYNGTSLKTDAGSNPSITVKMKINNSDDLVVEKSINNPDYHLPEPEKPVEKPKDKIKEKEKDKTSEPKKDPPVAKVDSVKIPAKIPEIPANQNTKAILSAITGVKDNEENLNSLLEIYKTAGLILVGKKSSFSDPAKCYIIVFDKDAGKTVAILEPGTNGRKDLLSGEFIEEIAKKYKGKTSIWFQIL